jgi:hypothetical protein
MAKIDEDPVSSDEEPELKPTEVDVSKYTVEESNAEKLSDYALYIFSKNSKFRKWCIKITSQRSFANFIFFVIFLNCITLAMENPSIAPNSCVSPKSFYK